MQFLRLIFLEIFDRNVRYLSLQKRRVSSSSQNCISGRICSSSLKLIHMSASRHVSECLHNKCPSASRRYVCLKVQKGRNCAPEFRAVALVNTMMQRITTIKIKSQKKKSLFQKHLNFLVFCPNLFFFNQKVFIMLMILR